MSGKFKLELNIPGFNAVRLSGPVQDDLHRRGEAIAEAAGGEEDFAVVDSASTTRARVVVITATPDAMRAEATERVLTQAFEAGRG